MTPAASSTRCGSRASTWRCGPACSPPKRRSRRFAQAIRRPPASSATRTRSMRVRCGPSCIPFATCTRRLATVCLPGWRSLGCRSLTGGRWLEDLHGKAGHERMKRLAWYYGTMYPRRAPSNATPSIATLTFDKVTNVHYSGTAHDEDQPSHLLVHTEVCSSVCGPSTATPAFVSVRRMSTRSSHEPDGSRGCRSTPRTACTARRATSWIPYQVITWVPPEGGGGPQYNRHVDRS